jgi:hypothetical protein
MLGLRILFGLAVVLLGAGVVVMVLPTGPAMAVDPLAVHRVADGR